MVFLSSILNKLISANNEKITEYEQLLSKKKEENTVLSRVVIELNYAMSFSNALQKSLEEHNIQSIFNKLMTESNKKISEYEQLLGSIKEENLMLSREINKLVNVMTLNDTLKKTVEEQNKRIEELEKTNVNLHMDTKKPNEQTKTDKNQQVKNVYQTLYNSNIKLNELLSQYNRQMNTACNNTVDESKYCPCCDDQHSEGNNTYLTDESECECSECECNVASQYKQNFESEKMKTNIMSQLTQHLKNLGNNSIQMNMSRNNIDGVKHCSCDDCCSEDNDTYTTDDEDDGLCV